MTRTYKDQPYRIKKKNLGIELKEDNCIICSKDKVEITRDFTAIFYAHEVNELALLKEEASKRGFEISTKEFFGRLITFKESSSYDHSPRPNKTSSIKSFYDEKRDLLGVSNANDTKEFSIVSSSEHRKGEQMGSLRALMKDFSSLKKIHRHNYPAIESFSRKDNLFIVVTLNKTFLRRPFHSHYGQREDYRLRGGYACRCAFCLSRHHELTSSEKTRLKKVTEVFNSGYFDLVDDIVDFV